MLRTIALGGIDVPWAHEYCHLPSRRPLYAILAEVVQHGVDFPTHGTECSCMDQYSHEMYAHVDRVLPEIEREPVEDWDGTVYEAETKESREARWAAMARVRWVLRMVNRRL